MDKMDLVIIGGGPAGLAAAVAAYDNGVLKLTLPKQGEVIPQSRKIAIE